MEVEIKPDSGVGGHVVVNLIQTLFSSIFTNHELSLVDKFIITQTDNYKSAVEAVNSTSTVTDNHLAVGVAKTIFIPEKNKAQL